MFPCYPTGMFPSAVAIHLRTGGRERAQGESWRPGAEQLPPPGPPVLSRSVFSVSGCSQISGFPINQQPSQSFGGAFPGFLFPPLPSYQCNKWFQSIKANSTTAESYISPRPKDDIRNICARPKAKPGFGNEKKVSSGETRNTKTRKAFRRSTPLCFISIQEVTGKEPPEDIYARLKQA